MTMAVQFVIGDLVITEAAAATLTKEEIFYGVARHCGGDWGDLDEFFWNENDRAVEFGGRLMSRYRTSRGKVFWIATEHDRSKTTVYLPLEH